MDDASWKNQGSQYNFNHSGLHVENSSKERMKGISYPGSSELSPHHNMAWDTNVPENGYLELGKCIESASSNINLDKKKHKVIMEDNNFHDGHNIKAHSNQSSEGLACNRHGPSNTSSLPYEEVNNLSFMRGKRKQHLSNFCESSGVASQNSETLCNQLSKRIPSDGWSSISSQNKSCGSDMELGEFRSPELRLNNYPELNFQFDDDSGRVCQIESDELLARQLQEQYNEEVAGVVSTNEREEPMSDLYAYYTRLASQNPLSRSSNHSRHQMSNARRSFHSSEIDLETRLVAELRNFTRMDSKKRRDLLEALEAAFDQSNGALDDLNRDNDEMLSRGASQEQIDSLPQYTIQGAKVEEMCSICLEVPSFGDQIRHLPCLHKFHLQCIDVWLGRKACCPVCKLKVS